MTTMKNKNYEDIDAAVEIATKMNEIRYMYIKKNNEIAKLYDDMVKTTKESEQSIFGPVISKQLTEEFINTLDTMKMQSTEIIEKQLAAYIKIIKKEQKEIHSLKARRFTKPVISILESSFAKNEYPTDAEKQGIAIKCNISAKQVNNWFTNKRNRAKCYKIHKKIE